MAAPESIRGCGVALMTINYELSLEAARQADLVRERLWVDGVFPVDPVTIAEKLGLAVREAELPDEVSGVIIKKVGEDPVIILESRDSARRKRFTCSHEVGHFIYKVEIEKAPDVFEWVDFRDSQSALGQLPEEIFANQFAANLLMPADAVRRRYKKGRPIWQVAEYFGVSDESMTFRLKKLGLL